jgi:hypothetical protein
LQSVVAAPQKINRELAEAAILKASCRFSLIVQSGRSNGYLMYGNRLSASGANCRDRFVQLIVQAIERKLKAIGNTKLLIKLT